MLAAEKNVNKGKGKGKGKKKPIKNIFIKEYHVYRGSNSMNERGNAPNVDIYFLDINNTLTLKINNKQLICRILQTTA
jgi:hypothetical protein